YGAFLAFSEVRRGVFERLRDAAADPAVDLGLPRVLQRTPAPPGPQLPDAGYRLRGHRRRAVGNHIRVICREGEGVTTISHPWPVESVGFFLRRRPSRRSLEARTWRPCVHPVIKAHE